MSETIYDKYVAFYVDFVDRALASQDSLLNILLRRIKEILGDRLFGARVGDIACGEGYLSRFLGQFAPQEVIGVDLSAALVEIAAQRSDASNI